MSFTFCWFDFTLTREPDGDLLAVPTIFSTSLSSMAKPSLLQRFGQARTPNTARVSHLSEWGRSALPGYLRDDPARGDGRATRDPSRQRARALALERRSGAAPRCDGEEDHQREKDRDRDQHSRGDTKRDAHGRTPFRCATGVPCPRTGRGDRTGSSDVGASSRAGG